MSEIVPIDPLGGNTKTPSKKQISPSIRWCFTLNNHTSSESSKIIEILKIKSKLYIIGDEIGDSGTPHLQGYVEFNGKVRPMGLFQNNRIHWEKSKGDKESNIKYCSKDKILSSKGLPKPIKILQNLYPWQKAIESICLEEPDDRTVHWYYDTKGNIGKSQFIKYMIVKYKALYCAGGAYSDLMNLVFNQNMDETSIVLFNIVRANKGKISYAALESIKDGMVCNTKYETGVKVFNSPHVICFANFPPESAEKLSTDRWKITCLDKGGTLDENEENDELDEIINKNSFVLEF